MRGSRLVMGCFCLTAVMSAVNGWAATARGESGAVDSQARMMLQRLTQENAKLKEDVRAKTAELDTLESELAESQGLVDDNSAKAKQLSGQLVRETQRSAALADQNELLRERLGELSNRFKSLAETLRVSEERGATLQSLSQDFEVRVAMCESNNENLYTVVQELADRYERRGFFRAIREREPFLQLKRAEVENLMTEYRQIAEDMRLKFGEEPDDQKITAGE